MERRGRKAERAEATRAALVRAARELFAEKGFAATGTEEVVRRARVTRGALYHHFHGKEDLFRAVFEALEAELSQRVASAASSGGGDPMARLRRGLDAFLDACLEAAVQRIVLLEGPSVLGWEAWHEIDARYGFALLTRALQAAMDAGALRRQAVEPLAYLLLGALTQAGLVVARAGDPGKARAELGGALHGLLDGLRA